MGYEPLAPAPVGFHYFGWHGVLLLLPAEWNLTGFDGDGGKGAVTISDLRGVRMGVRWRRPRRWAASPARQMERLVEGLGRRKEAKVQRVSGVAVQVDLAGGERLLLAHDGERLFELHWPEAGEEAERVAAFFLGQLGKAGDHWRWHVFGARGVTLPYVKMKRISLQPGFTEMTLTWGGGIADTFGAISMADRLLATQTLRQAAERQLNLGGLVGEWRDNRGFAMHFNGRVRRRILPGSIPFGFHIMHDREMNKIVWDLTTRVGFHRIWRSRA